MLISITSFFLFVPIVSIVAKILTCHPEEGSCYNSSHLALFIFAIIAIVNYMILTAYSHSLMTTCYPNENVPWAHFPSKVPYEKIIIRLAIILVYQID